MPLESEPPPGGFLFFQSIDKLVSMQEMMPFQLPAGARRAVALSLLGSCLMLAPCAQAQTARSIDVIYRLYKDYAWEAVFAAPDDAGKALGRPLHAQSPQVLARYFDAVLVRLLLQEQTCLVHHPGELCNLEFNPIFASQDPAASDLAIKSRSPDQIDVQYVYPSNGQTVRLTYRMVQTRAGWRIQDVLYPDSQTSLTRMLTRKPLASVR